MDQIKEASQRAGEPIWELPNNDEYRELIKGKFADLKNTGARGAGTITAGLFFVVNIHIKPSIPYKFL